MRASRTEGVVALDWIVFDFVIRFRGSIRVTSAAGETRNAKECLRPDGRRLELRGAGVTADDTSVDRVAIVRGKRMAAA
jgi:hypothetical protein